MHILVVNGGSSSIKFGLYDANDSVNTLLEGAIENIGQSSAALTSKNRLLPEPVTNPVMAPSHVAAARLLVDWLKPQIPPGSIGAIGHRIVHGGPKYFRPAVIDRAVLSELRQLTALDPEHLPTEISLIETFQQLFPDAQQVASFDTAFHEQLPNQARLLPIPRRYETQGIRRYGFHGLSYQYVMQNLEKSAAQEAAGRVVIAHLGSGVSLAAVKDGKSIDTTMGLTPTGGVPMSTRSGDLDPGVFLYIDQLESLTTEKFRKLVNFESGLLGVSGTSADMKQLLEEEATDSNAKDAVELFCYQVKKSIGSLAAALGGLDTLVFSGGMGENAPKIRSRVCTNLGFLGITIDEDRNNGSDPVISGDSSRVKVRVIKSDEARVIAQNTWQILKDGYEA